MDKLRFLANTYVVALLDITPLGRLSLSCAFI